MGKSDLPLEDKYFVDHPCNMGACLIDVRHRLFDALSARKANEEHFWVAQPFAHR